MAVQVGTQGQADFTEPFELLKDCHRRIEHFLHVLERVIEEYGNKPLDDQARRALTTALDYFALAAPKHTADEEESLFPRLRAVQDESLKSLIEHAAVLELDHRRAQVLHDRVDRIGRNWLKSDQMSKTDGTLMADDLRRLNALYAEHIAFEDEQLFPAAASALNASAQSGIGVEMAQRRGLDSGTR